MEQSDLSIDQPNMKQTRAAGSSRTGRPAAAIRFPHCKPGIPPQLADMAEAGTTGSKPQHAIARPTLLAHR